MTLADATASSIPSRRPACSPWAPGTPPVLRSAEREAAQGLRARAAQQSVDEGRQGARAEVPGSRRVAGVAAKSPNLLSPSRSRMPSRTWRSATSGWPRPPSRPGSRRPGEDRLANKWYFENTEKSTRARSSSISRPRNVKAAMKARVVEAYVAVVNQAFPTNSSPDDAMAKMEDARQKGSEAGSDRREPFVACNHGGAGTRRCGDNPADLVERFMSIRRRVFRQRGK